MHGSMNIKQISLSGIELFIMMDRSTLIKSSPNSLWSCQYRCKAFVNSTRPDSVRLGSTRHGSIHFDSSCLGPTRLGSARLGLVRFDSTRLYSFRFVWSRTDSTRLGSARLGSARLGLVRFHATRLDTTRLHTIRQRYGKRLCKIRVSTFTFNSLLRVQTWPPFFATLWTNNL
jgi:hypothetical protein